MAGTGRIIPFNYWKRRVPIAIRYGLFAGLENEKGDEENAYIKQEIITKW
jgi:hypothetical protein